MIDTNAPFPSPEDIELDAFYRAQDDMIQEEFQRQIDTGELNPDDLCSLPYYGSIEDEPMILPKHLKPRTKLIGRNFKEHKESLLKRLFSFLFR